jgi:hypothetical protein
MWRRRRTALLACLSLALAAPAAAESLEEMVTAGVTPDSLAVTGAVAQLLRGRTDAAAVAPAVVPAALAEPVAGQAFLYDAFDLDGVSIGNYGPAADGAGINLTGMLHYADPWGRRAVSSFGADYVVAGETLAVSRLDARPLYMPLPEVALFYVPAAAVPASTLRALPRTFDAFYALAADHAVVFDPPWGVPTEPAEYYVLAFFMERVAPDARVELVIGGDADSLDGEGAGEMLFDDLGFPMLAARARLALNTQPETLVKVIHTPGSEIVAEQRTPALIGLFSTIAVAGAAAEAPDIALDLRPLPDFAAIAQSPTPETAPAPAAQAVPEPKPAPGAIESRLAAAKRLFEKGLISEDEYEAKRREILSDL